jgi:hypothetical protein
MSAARETVAFLLREIPPKKRWRHAYVPPLAPAHAVTLSPGAAQRRLLKIHKMLAPCEGLMPLLADPVMHARMAISAKAEKRPGELQYSAKLFRAIDDLELARTLPQLAAHVDLLEAVIDELRELTGWKPED